MFVTTKVINNTFTTYLQRKYWNLTKEAISM